VFVVALIAYTRVVGLPWRALLALPPALRRERAVA
jgi:hypothetical protein